MFILPGGLPLRYGAAEPVLETRRADARVIAGGEALIVQLCAEVECVDVCGHLPCVSVRDPPARPCRSPVPRLRRRPVRQRRHLTRWVAQGQVTTEPFARRWPIGRCRSRTRRTALSGG